MPDLDLSVLKKQLLQIYSDLLAGKNVKSEARNVYDTFLNADFFLDEDTGYAIRKLVDVGYETGIKLTNEEAREILKKISTPKP